MLNLSRRGKKIVLSIIDGMFIIAAFTIAHIFLAPYVERNLLFYIPEFLLTVLLYLIVGWFFKVFSRINRYVDMTMIAAVLYTVSLSFFVHVAINRFLLAAPVRLRFLALSYLLMILLICISRFLWSLLVHIYYSQQKASELSKRTLVIGAGEVANLFFKNLEVEEHNYQIVGVIDDNENKVNAYFHNVRVLGTMLQMIDIIREHRIEHIIIAIPSLPPARIESIVSLCNSLGVTVNRMPHVQDILLNGFEMSRLRDVDVGDLLGRDVVKLDVPGLKQELEGKVLLVTGAGGSIGAEICRQVLKFRPEKIILLGQGENSIYNIHRELNVTKSQSTTLIPVIADVKDKARIQQIMKQYAPHIVYHAAAHKHVPLMEDNPMEAVKNNIYGTKNVAEAAIETDVDKFVMISTDKAVNPTNVMGATKRIAELIVTGIDQSQTGGTKFSAVRFGNVLGSRGSVIPLFKEQIAKGGPVTITDFRMTRYFMTIAEASSLVVQSGMLSRGGEVFILDMGEPVRIYDLAKKLIKLSGFTEAQIPIKETGSRPGEKLFEELLLTGEEVKQNIFEKIFVGIVATKRLEEVMAFVDDLRDDEHLKDKLISYANEKCSNNS